MGIERKELLILGIVLAGAMILSGCVGKEAPSTTPPEVKLPPPSAEAIAQGGRLYDKWWEETPGAQEPAGNQPLWATQTTNIRSGKDTWRCKECHGWDYKGRDGAYSSGSHYTGFQGVYTPAQTRSQEDLLAALKGRTNPKHDFSSLMPEDRLNSLTAFLKYGLVDQTKLIDYKAKAPIAGDAGRGKGLYDTVCIVCHGADGKMINFGSEAKPEYVGMVAGDNPWEFVHKVRNGQPGSVPAMPAAIVSGWTDQNVVDVLAYAQSLEE